MAQGDVTRIESVTRILISEALTFLAYELDVSLTEQININANT